VILEESHNYANEDQNFDLFMENDHD